MILNNTYYINKPTVGIVTFSPTNAQKLFLENIENSTICYKNRQVGITTVFMCSAFEYAQQNPGSFIFYCGRKAMNKHAFGSVILNNNINTKKFTYKISFDNSSEIHSVTSLNDLNINRAGRSKIDIMYVDETAFFHKDFEVYDFFKTVYEMHENGTHIHLAFYSDYHEVFKHDSSIVKLYDKILSTVKNNNSIFKYIDFG